MTEEMIEALKLPIKVVVDYSIEEATLTLNPEHYSKLMEVLTRVEYEHDAWKFRRILEGIASE